ncbi:hypothetical protein [Paenibacillus psychroresistens]|uniref:hypothetical protein n=1 Tax=Paenibacillus psychroresistens TaxID=1778678 RepID=UPI0012DA3288|nr:hypothetical protein [Paenibacillus psychroresistens]
MWDINTIEIEMGKIVRWDSYYFSMELLREAARTLKLKADTSKAAYGKKWSERT